MNGAATKFTVGTIAIGVLVALTGALASGGDAARGVVWGAAAGAVVQIVIFWGLFVWAFPGQSGLAHGLGIFVRFVAVGGMAFVGAEAVGLPAAPTLFSMVACLFGSTLLEALILRRQMLSGSGSGAMTIRTQH